MRCGRLFQLFCLCAFCLPLWAGELPRGDLDRLAAERLPVNSHVVRMVTPQSFTALARVDNLPERGRTTYLQDAMVYRGLAPKAPVNHKLMLRTPAGVRLMAYVDDVTAARMQKELAAGDLLMLTALQLWQSRHGPGLLITDFTPAGLGERVQLWWAQW